MTKGVTGFFSLASGQIITEQKVVKAKQSSTFRSRKQEGPPVQSPRRRASQEYTARLCIKEKKKSKEQQKNVS